MIRILTFCALVGLVSAACSDFLSCADCIQGEVVCGWCGESTIDGLPRCVATGAGGARPASCGAEWYYPRSVVTSETDPGLSATNALSPTAVTVQLRPYDPLPVTLNTRNIRPDVDLYLIQDLSGSFRDDLSTLRSVAPSLLSGVGSRTCERTGCASFGVGNYIDKPQRPFGGTSDYDFRHSLSITSNQATVTDVINRLSATGGADGPESQFTGLFEVASCPDLVGWRTGTRRMIFLTTDNTHHDRGEGLRYHGSSQTASYWTDAAVQPNGFDCKPDLHEDYPSLPHLKRTLERNNIIPIFACTSSYKADYDEVKNFFGFGSSTTLNSDSSNLLAAIETGYDQASLVVRLAISEDRYNHVQSIAPPNGYTNVAFNAENAFVITLLFDPIAEPLSVPHDIDLSLLGLGFFTISVEYYSACGCEAVSDLADAGILASDPRSPGVDMECPGDCSGHGVCNCGACECTPGYVRDDCSCFEDSKCEAFGECSGHGSCVCGVCECFEGYNETSVGGPSDDCSCSSSACPLGVGGGGTLVECSGHGTCLCGECVCDSGFDGDEACSCATSACPMIGGAECAGHGSCVCGECICDRNFGGGAPVDCSCSQKPCPYGCSGHGNCSCGTCACEPGFDGLGCECASTPCPLGDNGLPCSGPEHGYCDCGVCKCNAFYTGDACDCSTEPCFRAPGGEPCDGHGNCSCGECICDDGWRARPPMPDFPETGVDCECNFGAPCPDCVNGNCSICGDCICETGWAGENCDVCFGAAECQIRDPCEDFADCTTCIDRGCQFCPATSKCQSAGCPDPINKGDRCPGDPLLSEEAVAGLAAGIAVAMCLVGLAAILIFRLLTYLKDKKEYAAWEEEQKRSKWKNDDNPLFKNDTKEGQNALYGS